ncbi:MAG: SLBB domain-containing protein [Clostridia bacterium]|nr:SLBB domain-containing protein [Clostridia bacterium]
MDIAKLKDILQNAGVTGAGGAGFPSYAKLNKNADVVILNCAECEPLLKVHRQLLAVYASEIINTMSMITEVIGAKEFAVGIKKEYTEAVEAVKTEIKDYKNGRIHLLNEVYPSGDEVILTYDVTKRLVPPGGIPIDVGVIVYNVETVLNIYNAVKLGKNVTHKYVTVAGEVHKPQTVKVPIGTKFSTLLEFCGGKTVSDTALIQGGPMTGRKATENDTVTKTTNAVLVLPNEHYLINKRNQKVTMSVKRAMSACCQCKTCTEMCPRNLLGHPINPGDFMRSLTSDIANTNVLLNTQYCSQCGVCEMYACPQGLSPATLIGIYKSGLRKNNIKPEKLSAPQSAKEERNYRQIPMSRLIRRLDIVKYDVPAPLCDEGIECKKVKIYLSQSIGAPAVPCVEIGDAVKTGDKIADPKDAALSLALHSSINGTVTDITDKYILISSK